MTTLREAEMRLRVVVEARGWIGTPYHHHGRVRGVGVDCAQILAAVYESVGLVPHLDLGNYSTQWHLHRGEETYLQWLRDVGAREVQAPAPGDVGVWRFGRTFSHGGIVIEGGADPVIVHSYIGRGVIVSRASEQPLAGRPACYWSIV